MFLVYSTLWQTFLPFEFLDLDDAEHEANTLNYLDYHSPHYLVIPSWDSL